ncbi:phosphotransferase [Pseudoneobacillus sp. C159]
MHFDKQAQTWIKEVISKNNLERIDSFEGVKVADLSLVQKIYTNQGNFYFKQTAGASRFESKLAQLLYTTFPDKTVEILATHPTEPWYIMRELKGVPLRQIRDKRLWKQTLQEYADFQINLANQVDSMLETGVPNRQMNVLKKEIQNHLTDMCVTGLNENETAKILALQSELIQLCDLVEGLVPYTLDHGDLHAANIQWVNNHAVFFDWGDAAVSHPFFSTRIFWNALYDLIDSDSLWYETVKEFRPYYLEPWTQFAPLSDLEKLLNLTDQLACVYRAIGWHYYINPHLKDKQLTKQRPAQWLKLFLEQRAWE